MRAFAWMRSFFRTLFGSSSLDEDVDDEVRFAHAELAARHEQRGMTPDQARRAAVLEIGGFDQIRERSREMRVGAVIERFSSDVRQAIRALRRAPSFSAAVILTFGLGIGATVAIFTVAKAVLLEPLPLQRP